MSKLINEVLVMPIKIVPRNFVEKTLQGEYEVNPSKPLWLIGAPSSIYGVDVEINGIDLRDSKKFIVPFGECLMIPTHEILLTKVKHPGFSNYKDIIDKYKLDRVEFAEYNPEYKVLIQIRRLLP